LGHFLGLCLVAQDREDHAVHLGLVAQEELFERCLVAAGHLLQQGPLEYSVADALIVFSRDLHLNRPLGNSFRSQCALRI